MERRQFTREFKLEAVRLIKERRVVCAVRRAHHCHDGFDCICAIRAPRTFRTISFLGQC